MHKGVLLCIISFLGFNFLSAQSTITGTEIFSEGQYKVLDSKFESYRLFRIDVKKTDVQISSKNPFLDFQLGDQVYNMNLYADNISISYESKTKPHVLGGSLRHGGSVSMTINDDFIFGFIKEGSNKMYIEPLRHMEDNVDNNLFIVYNVHDVIQNHEHKCGVEDVAAKTDVENIQKMITDECKIVDFAIANMFDMLAAFGNSTTNLMNFNLAVLNDVQTLYRSEFDVNVEYNVVAHYVPTSASGNPLSPLTGTDNGSVLLNNFASWAGPGGSSNGSSGGFGVDFDMAAMWIDLDFFSSGSGYGTIGLAYRPGWFQLLEYFYNSSAPEQEVLWAHEIGHNWNCIHAGGPSFVMSSSVNVTDDWAASSINSFNARMNSPFTSHLLNCSTIGTPNADFFQSALAVCSGSSVTFEDQSQYGATRDWEFNTGSPATSIDEKPSVTFNTAGLQYVKITSENGAGSDDFYSYVDIQSASTTACAPSGSGGSSGINLIRIGSIVNASSASGLYEDFSCSDVTQLEPDTDYNIIVGAFNVNTLRLFFDFNGDNDFTDSGESSFQYTLNSGNVNYSIPFTTSSSPDLAKLLRIRVICTNNASIPSSGCISGLSAGQVEDYSIYFPETQILGCTDPTASNYNPNATVDDGTCTVGMTTWYRDFDSDTFGDINDSQQSASQPAGYVLDNTDCDDMNSNKFPGNPEVCDGLDNNCDGNIDEGVSNTYYIDMDGDGFGNPSNSTMACTQPSGYVSNNTDCDDNDSDEFPGQIWYKDIDGDDYSDGVSNSSSCTRPNNYYTVAELIDIVDDCDDLDATAFPGNPEVCDGVDNNCDGQTDEGLMTMYFRDFDGDGYGNASVFTQSCNQPVGYVLDDTDCDDNEANAFPGNPEVCDGIDNNCFGGIDEGVMTTYYRDLDGDGFGDSGVTQLGCSAPSGFVENDDDCDDFDDLEFPDQIWYRDFDGDGYSNGNQLIQCQRPNNNNYYYTASELIATSGDCVDNNDEVYPNAVEVCNDNLDNDCNGFTDESCGPCDGGVVTISSISKDEYRASNRIESNATLDNNQSILFTAQNSINLNGGFEIEAGTVFLADIYPCDNTAQDNDSPINSNANPIEKLESGIKNKLGESDDLIIQLLNKFGEIVFEKANVSSLELKSFLENKLYDVESGYYILNVKSDEKSFTQSIFVE